MDDDKVEGAWKTFLNPTLLRQNLILASIYLAAFELLKQSIIERIRDFYVLGFDGKEVTIDPTYESDVLAKNRSPVYASLQWLRESDAIEDADIAVFNEVRQTRNRVAHEITQILTEGLSTDYVARFQDMVGLLEKIERWWIVNFEIPINPDMNDKEINEDGIVSGSAIALRLLLDIALGSEQESRFYFDEYIKRQQRAT